MARASTYTLIPLDSFAAVVGVDPYHFNMITTTGSDSRFGVRNDCDDVWYQYEWQRTGAVSRESMAIALKRAEDRVAEILRTPLIPWWFTGEETLKHHHRPELFARSSINIRGQHKSVITPWSRVVEVGQRTKEVIEAGAAVTYSDSNGDGYSNLATVSVVTTVTDPQEIYVYNTGKSGADVWEIRPITVSISEGVATITFERYQGVEPDLLDVHEFQADSDYENITIDGESTDGFVDTVDVYRVYSSPSTQATFYTERGGIGLGSNHEHEETGALSIRDHRRGFLAYSRADWDEDDELFDPVCFDYGREADRIEYYYRAGLTYPDMPMPNRQMDPGLQADVCWYALSLLDTEVCGCSNFQAVVSYMKEDLAKATRETSYSITTDQLQNRLGTSRAALQLWARLDASFLRVP